ncbi:ATP synthase subunit gamma, mitochondrial-like [Lineus longissimus]|uniref:ATP synthase subunit gamma, mitochondrial-like n=1 Tax=Lineus longissimus TaxID=88925 RepID=UPI002B4D6238
MYSRAAVSFSPICTQVRGMATLKDISVRLKSVKNIQKITASMKMVSAAKFNRAERELKPARAYGHGAQEFFEKAECTQDESKPNHLILALTSDRGLCGACHSTIVKQIRAYISEAGEGANVKIIAVGDKSRAMLQRTHGKHILSTITNIGKKPSSYADAALIANQVLTSGFEYDFGQMYYNIFKTVVSYKTATIPLFSLDQVSNAEKLSLYDSIDEETLRSYNEFALSSLIYFGLKESATSEQSSRMTAMDGATKNAGEMIDKLTLTFNRTRQAVITRELIEIISGAAALKK